MQTDIEETTGPNSQPAVAQSLKDVSRDEDVSPQSQSLQQAILPSGGYRAPSQLVATSAFGQSVRVVLPYTFEGDQVRDVLLISQVKSSFDGAPATAVVAWLVDPESSSDAALEDFVERHVYLLRVIRSAIGNDPELALFSGPGLDLQALASTHPEELPKVGAIGITAPNNGFNLFERVRERLTELVNPSDPLVIGLYPRGEAKSQAQHPQGQSTKRDTRSYRPTSADGASTGVEKLSPQAASAALISFLVAELKEDAGQVLVHKAVLQVDDLASLWPEARISALGREKLFNRVKKVLPEKQPLPNIEARLRGKIEELSSRIEADRHGEPVSLLRRVIEALV